MEKPSQTLVVSTITMGKAMGSSSGIGRVGAGAIRGAPNPMMCFGFHMGMDGAPGGAMGMGGGRGPAFSLRSTIFFGILASFGQLETQALQASEQFVHVNQDTGLNDRVFDLCTPANQGIFCIQYQVEKVSSQTYSLDANLCLLRLSISLNQTG